VEGVEVVSAEHVVGRMDEWPPGTVTWAGRCAVGNAGGEYFAVGRRCRHLGGDLATGGLDQEGQLVCPLHRSLHDVRTGQMVRDPQDVFAKVPGLGATFRATRLLLLRRGKVVEGDGCPYVR
jgi:nitrite reductase/ring-hydroxylating ferredoxin subunit